MLESLGLRVNRLDPRRLRAVHARRPRRRLAKEVETAALRAELGEKIVAESGADFDAPLVSDDERCRRQAQGQADARSARTIERRPARDARAELDSGARADARQRNDNEKIGGARSPKKKKTRRDRSKSGPRPKYPRARNE